MPRLDWNMSSPAPSFYIFELVCCFRTESLFPFHSCTSLDIKFLPQGANKLFCDIMNVAKQFVQPMSFIFQLIVKTLAIRIVSRATKVLVQQLRWASITQERYLSNADKPWHSGLLSKIKQNYGNRSILNVCALKQPTTTWQSAKSQKIKVTKI